MYFGEKIHVEFHPSNIPLVDDEGNVTKPPS
jgi:hypothetical protein